MKWMGGWSWDDLCQCPQDYYTEIIRMINEEVEEYENR